MIELLLFIVIGFSIGLAHHSSADVKWSASKDRPFYERASKKQEYKLMNYNPVTGPDFDIWIPPAYEADPVTPIDEGESFLIRMPDGTYKWCKYEHGGVMCHPVI